MSCCNSNFKGDNVDEYEAEISEHDNFVDDDSDEFEAEISEHDNFLDEEDSYDLDFTGEVEDGENDMDDFLGKRAKERRRLRKLYREQGMSKKDARKQARKDAKAGVEGGILSKIIKKKAVELIDPDTPEKTAVDSAITNAENEGAIDNTLPPKKAGFLNQYGMVIGGVAVIGIVGFVLWKKGVFGGKGKK